MRRTSTCWKDVKGNLQHAGKMLKKELGTVTRVVGRVAEPGFSRRERRRVLHLKRIEEHELRSLAITRQRLQIERDREALRYRKAGIERSRGGYWTTSSPSEDLKMALARVAATRQREKDLKAYREKTQSLIEEREAAAIERQHGGAHCISAKRCSSGASSARLTTSAVCEGRSCRSEAATQGGGPEVPRARC